MLQINLIMPGMFSVVKMLIKVKFVVKFYLVLFPVLDGDDCADNPCEDGATCLDGFFSFTCVCPNGSFGDRCQSKSI